MADEPNDSEFQEIHVDAAPPADGAAVETPPAAEQPEPEKPESEEPAKEGEEESPLRDEEGRFKSRASERIDALTRARREAERAADYWRGIATQNGAKPGDTAAPKSKPSPDDFEDYGEYVEALTDWKVSEREQALTQSRVKEAEQSAEAHKANEWGAKLAAAKAILPDFDAVMEKADTPTLPHVAQAIMDADRGPELLHYLANHSETVERLNDMSPNRAAMELGRIEATLGAAPTPARPRDTTQTKAPAPITPVTTGSTTAKDPAAMTQDEYKAFRAAQGIR